jgi:hypothetical protein
MSFVITLSNDDTERVSADAYQQEGPLTTFFRTAGRDVVDCWAIRLASFRTADIRMILLED